MGMDLRHALALLLVLLPLAVVTMADTIKQKDGGFGSWDHCSSDNLAVTTAYTIEPKDGGFGSWDYCSSDNLTTHSILEWGPKSDDHGKDILFSYPHVAHNFIDLDMNDDGKDFLFSYAHVAHNFIALDMSGCHAGACGGASEIRRGLAYRKKYISYEALKKYRIPCNRRGKSYYNCKRGRQANPYRRGCSFITRCAKIW